jgi:hypothetical protein
MLFSDCHRSLCLKGDSASRGLNWVLSLGLERQISWSVGGDGVVVKELRCAEEI